MKKQPVLGPAFDQDQTDADGRVENYISELQYYRPRGFSKLVREGMTQATRDDPDAWMTACEDLLTEWARRVTRNDYIYFGSFEMSGDVGFQINVDCACDDADLRVNDLSEIPRGFSGLVVKTNDHGNVTGHIFSRGRKIRELFAVV
jgi:hypothetical protein